MTSDETVEVGPRRRWGWIFVVIFLIELAAVSSRVSNRKTEIENLRIFLPKGSVYETYVQIQALEKEINQSYLWAAVLLPVTLVCAGFGLRRRITMAEPTPATEGGSS